MARTRLSLVAVCNAAILAAFSGTDHSTLEAVGLLGGAPGLTARGMKVSSPIFNEISGKLGGAVGLTTASGMILRSRVTPNNPQTDPQFLVRGILSSLTARWGEVLTAAEREGWENLADDTPGSASGINLFVKGNSERLRAEVAAVNTAPVTMSCQLTPPTSIVVDDSSNNLTFDIQPCLDASDPWILTGGFLNVYVTRQQPQSRSTRIHPYKLVGTVLGNTGTPPTDSQTFSLATITGTTAGRVMYVKFTSGSATGQRSLDYVYRALIVA